MNRFQRWLTRQFIGPFRELKRPANQVDYTLEQRIVAARKRLPANNVKSLRRQLEDAVANGDRDEAKRLTRETFKAMGVQ